MAGAYRRRRLIVDRRMQSEIVTAVSWPAAVSVVVAAAVMGLFCAKLTEQALEVGLELDGVFSMLITALGFVLVSSAYFLFNCLKVSHRVAGPIYRMKATLRAVREGAPETRATLREGDFLGDLADELNEFLEWATPYLPRMELEEIDEVDADDDRDDADHVGELPSLNGHPERSPEQPTPTTR